MSRSGLAIGCGALVLLAMMCVGVGVDNSSAATATIPAATPALDDGWIRLESLPDQPPAVHLRRAGSRVASADADPSGVLVMSDWVIDGKPTSYDMPPPIAWPDAILYPGEQLTVDLGLQGTPVLAEIRFYRQLDDRGLPVGEPIVAACGSGEPNEASPGPGAHPCILERDAKTNARIVSADLPPAPGRYFVAVWTAWMIPQNASGANRLTPMSAYASWIFAIDRP